VTTLGELLGKPINLFKTEEVIKTLAKENIERFSNSMKVAHFNEALDILWELVRFSDKYVADHKVWETIKIDQEKAEIELANLVYVLAHIGWNLKPFMPETGERILKSLNLESIGVDFLESLINKTVTLKKAEGLFPRHGQS
jgi:methionyl-tRNA synthetase